MNETLNRAVELKQELMDFVLDAEGDLAIALETFTAEQLKKTDGPDMNRREFAVDRFLVQGKVNGQSPLELFIQTHPELTEGDRQLVHRWQWAFMGLFAVIQWSEDRVELVNWLTQKHYWVEVADSPLAQPKFRQSQSGEIVLTQIAPLTAERWMLFSSQMLLGKLGKPKLAVALGNFKQNYKPYLYSDAPELLEEAWKSVERYHTKFVEFFGSDEVTLPGYQLGKKLTELQSKLTQENLEATGIDGSKSLKELAEAAGVTEEEIAANAEEMGVNAQQVKQAMNSSARMASPQVELPPHLKKAEAVTALSHPRWGQMFLPTYTQVEAVLQAEDWKAIAGSEKLVRQSLEDLQFNAFVWRRLAEKYPIALQTVLQDVLQQPTFNRQTDLDEALQRFNQPLEAELPEIASVPLHLHELFQDAVAEVNKTNNKNKPTQKKAKSGFKK